MKLHPKALIMNTLYPNTNRRLLLITLLVGMTIGYSISLLFQDSTHFYHYYIEYKNGNINDQIINLNNVRSIKRISTDQDTNTFFGIQVNYDNSDYDKLYFYNKDQMNESFDKLIRLTKPISTHFEPK